jgi:hypothetical protein
MNNEQKNSEDSIRSSHGEEIVQINTKEKQIRTRLRDETYDQIAKSPQIQYWLNIINDNKTLTQ